MAGEITKTTRTTNADATPGTNTDARLAKARTVTGLDKHEFAAATELEAADTKIFNIDLPSNAIIKDVEIYNDDLDTSCSPTLTLDVGLVAKEKHTSTTGGTDTTHAADALIDVDLLVDGSTEGQTANTTWTSLIPDSGTFGPDDCDKAVWELLGYDEDPKTTYRVALTSAAAAAALAAAADCGLRVTYLVD